MQGHASYLDAHRLGDILARRGLISHAQVENFLLEWSADDLTPLGARLLELGRIGKSDLRSALEEQRLLRSTVMEHVQHIPRLGEILHRRGLLGSDDLAQALDEQAASWEALGSILLRRGKLALKDLAALLSEQKNLRNVAVAALIGAAVIGLAMAPAAAGAFGDTSSESVIVSVTIPKRIEVQADQAMADYLDVSGAITMCGAASIVPLKPFSGPVHIEAQGSGPGGALMLRGDDGQTYPYHVEFYDPATDEHFDLGDGHAALDFSSLSDMPPMMQVNLADGAVAPPGQAATGTLVITVSSGI